MASYSSGNQSCSNVVDYLNITTPVHLPPLISTRGEDSPYLPVAHKAQAPSIPSYTDTPPERQGVDFGQVDYFKYINNDNEVLKTCELHVKLAGLAAIGGGTSPRYVDDILCAAIDKVEFQFGGNVLMTLYGDEMHFRTEQETPEEELDRKYTMQAAGLSPTRRAYLAQNPQWVKLEIPFWWARSSNAAWHQWALQRTTRVVITWRSRDYLLQQDGVSGFPSAVNSSTYIMDHFLRCQVVAPTKATRDAYKKLIVPTGNSGWLYMINDWERVVSNQLSKGAKDHIIQLNTLTKYGYNVRFWVRPIANLQPDPLNNRRWDRIDIKECWLDISGKRFFPRTDASYLKSQVNGKKFLGNPNLPTYNLPLCDAPDLHSHAMGGLDFSCATTPQLTLSFDDVLDVNYYCDVYLYCHNYVRVVINGNSSAAEVVQPL